jgi:hypothetical protein
MRKFVEEINRIIEGSPEKLEEGKLKMSDVVQIKRLTQANNHQEAALLGAQMLGANVLAKKLELVIGLAKLERGIPGELAGYAYSLYKELMHFAQRELSDGEFSLFHDAY